MSPDGGKGKKREDELVGAVSSDNDKNQGEKSDEIERKRKLQNKIRCQRYRDKRKRDITINSRISQHQAITVEEEIIIKRRKEQDKQKSKRYRDKKRAANLINLQTDQPSKTIAKHVPERQNFHTSQIPGPSTRNVPYIPPTHTPNAAGPSIRNELYIPIPYSDYNADFQTDIPLHVNYVPQLDEPMMVNYASNSQNILPRDAQNNIQNMCSQHNLSVQTYSSFQQNSSAHREFQKDFLENDFGHVCDICDRLWFKKDLKIFINNDMTPNIQFIRTMVENADLAEIKICSTCLASINKNRVPPLSVYNGFKYSPLPENLRNYPLDLITERLISPRIPFMQIRRLRHIHEELSFPQIYLGQFRTFRDGLAVTPFMMATSELRRSDRRGVTPQHLLYLAMKIMRIRIRESLSIAFKHAGKGTTITKVQTESEDYVQGCIESILAFLRTIPNSAYYWSERKKDLFAMIRQYGKPTVFFTISANEIGWPKLLQLLHNLKNNSEISVQDAAALNFIEKSTLINEDAVTCAIYFNKLVNVLMKILQSKRFSPFKKYRILYYFKRIEFQHRGSPNAHILAWLDNAPEDALGKDYSKAIDLIDFLISVSAAEASGNIKLQTHKHTFTCYKGVSSKRMQKCRFEAPFMPIKTTMILTPMKDTEYGFKVYQAKYNYIRKNLENYEYDDFQTFYENNNIHSDQEYVDIIRAGINRPKVFPKRQPNEKWHNPFNPFMLNIVKSNTDFQFITEEYSCAAYVVEYVNRTNRGVSNLQRKIIEIMDEHPEFDIFEITKHISINLLNHTEITSQEAAWYLLREPISKSSTAIVYIPTVWPIERQRIKKTMKELSELDDDCTDIWKENWFDKYEKRSEDLEGISLAQFVSKYFKNNKGEYVKRDQPRVIRYRNYDMATDFNEYKREMVTLHIPFRREEADILENMKFIRLYDENADLIIQKRKEFESNVDIEGTLQICRESCREEVPDDNVSFILHT
ncbi:helitron_like_N domain-containing protein [Trichonephila clavata]|uniref:Helitron_like_N domain-containing protein n=1 Tax=Trichonephila clavata TaxID=2740835 RepID=A0A8X6HFQ8_TRICU|nr:helitron_like_N domain-containing protein [Trichonephila clavata]